MDTHISNQGPLQKPKIWWKPKPQNKGSQKSSTSATRIWWSSTSTILMSIWSTPETKHLMDQKRHEPNTGVLPWIRLHILSGIGGKSQILTARILRRLKVTSQNWQTITKKVIASTETGVDIRLASTSITNPHCKGQLILRPDKMTLRKLSTHAPQVVHEETGCCFSNKQLTASHTHTQFFQNWTTHRDEWTFN